MTATQPAPAPQINPLELQATIKALNDQLAIAKNTETALRTTNEIINSHRNALMKENSELKAKLSNNGAKKPTPKKATKKAAPKK